MKICFETLLEKFGAKGEKSGWTYISIPVKVTEQLKPGFKKSFRVKGLLDEYPIHSTALIPMGDGQYIMAINATMRKAIRKNKGAKVAAAIEVDDEVIPLSTGLLECLQDEPAAMQIFSNLPASHQQYFSKWIETAKTDATKVKRIAIAVNGLARNMDFGAMLREQKNHKAIP